MKNEKQGSGWDEVQMGKIYQGSGCAVDVDSGHWLVNAEISGKYGESSFDGMMGAKGWECAFCQFKKKKCSESLSCPLVPQALQQSFWLLLPIFLKSVLKSHPQVFLEDPGWIRVPSLHAFHSHSALLLQQC